MVLASLVSGLASSACAQEKGLVFAHRGGLREFDENTLNAFHACYEKGLRGFETDVRMTKDGQLVILHDDSLDRTHNATGAVEQKTAAELRTITSKKTGQPFLFLEDLLAYFDDKPGVYLELEMKTSNKDLYPDARVEEYCRKLYELARTREPKGSFYVCTSFDQRPLKFVKTLEPEADLLLITGGPCCPEIVKQAQDMGIKRIGCRMEETSRGAVRAAQKAGMLVTGWPGHNLQGLPSRSRVGCRCHLHRHPGGGPRLEGQERVTTELHNS